ncbi:MAG: helix-turn-helix transcriptional regulator [Desulfosarcinaceae bacterium]|nr:helix-turn-helix transcriptional regulator [Desulfosarcinaceae bacterium]
MHAVMPTMGAGKPLGEMLRYWRARRKISQMDLALLVDVSPRHLSFVENGRSHPSRELVLRLGAALDLPLRQRNSLLTAAGFAPEFGHTPLNGAQMALVHQTLRRVLDTHEPYPALAVDSAHEILMTNSAFDETVAWFAGEAALRRYPNIYRLTFAKDGLRSAFKNWDMVARFMLNRLQAEALASQHEALFTLYEEMTQLCNGDVPTEDPIDQQLPILRFAMEKKGLTVSFFSTITTFGTPLDVTAQELRIESLFPADEITRHWFQQRTAGSPACRPSAGAG